MKYAIDKDKGLGYLQLYRQLRDDIVNGVYACGGRLPSKRVLAEECGISTITVEHAYALLCDEGYAEARERSGYFVLFRPSDGFALPEMAAEPPMPAPKAEHPQTQTEFPYSLLARTMRRVIANYSDKLLRKAPNAGCLEFRTALKEYLARNRGIRVDEAQIVIGSGAEYLYGLIVELLGRSKKFAVEFPSYNKIEQVYQAEELSYEPLPLTDDGIDSAALAASGADVLHTTPYRSFPSGVTASASKRHEYIRWAGRADRYIIEDDFESEFSVSTKPMETLYALSDRDNVIYLNTFSKTISPAFRVAYMVLPHKLVQPFYDKLGFYSCTVPAFEQFVITELIRNGDFERHINRVRRVMRKEQSRENPIKRDRNIDIADRI